MNENNQPDRLAEGEKTPDDELILDLTEAIPISSPDVETADAQQFVAGEPDEEDAASFDFNDDSSAATTEFEGGYGDEYGIDQDDDDFVTSLGMEIGTDEEDEDVTDTEDLNTPALDAIPGGALDIPPEVLDAALERVIQKMF
ncbi:MAG: hypothetical protein KKH68_09165, partial [Proteobacteria bacterium]|nr:hypothetical protein [Pseudomonadota bacterium]